MPSRLLQKMIEQINSLENLQTTPVECNFSYSIFNTHSIYTVTGVTATIKTKGATTRANNLQVVFSTPLMKDNGVVGKNIKDAIRAEDTLIRKRIDSAFNHTYLYRGANGTLISEYTELSDLFNFSKTEIFNDHCSLENLRELIAQVLLAVDNYHAKRLAHRDIKPENFLVFEQNGKYILKLCDHDDVIEVNNFGVAIHAPLRRVGSVEYHSPEYIVDAEVLANMDYRANDCYAVGLTVKFLLERMTQQKSFQTSTALKPDFALQLQLLSALIASLTCPKPESRACLNTALDSPFFGKDETRRKRYFQQVNASAKRSLSINGYVISGSIAELNDAHYLLPMPINVLYRSGTDVAHLMETFYPSFHNFASAKNSKYSFRQIKMAAKKHANNVSVFIKTHQPCAKLLRHLREFEMEYQSEMNELNEIFKRNFAMTIQHVIVESVANYQVMIKNAATRNLCATQPTFFQRINFDDANDLVAEITPDTDYKTAFKKINDYLGDQRTFGGHTFKNILMKNLLHVLYESLQAMRNKVDATMHVNKRARHS